MKECLGQCVSTVRCSKCLSKLCYPSMKENINCNITGHYIYNDRYICVSCFNPNKL